MIPAFSMSQAEQLERDSKLEDAVLAYSGILARNPKNERAVEALESLRGRLRAQREPSADTKAELEADLAAGRHFDAAESCGALLKTFRESHFLWDFLGRCHLAAGHLDNAATCLNKACGMDPKAAGTYAAMGRVHTARGELDNALALFQKALTLDADCLLALRSMAEVLPLLGRTAEATAALQQAVSLAPQDATVHLALAGHLRAQGADADAANHYGQAASLNPGLTEAHFQLGLLHKEAGRYADALPCFDRILEISPSDDRARTQRLHVLAMLNDWRWEQEYEDCRRLLGLRGGGCDPSALMLMEDNPDLLRARAQAYASDLFHKAELLAAPPLQQRPQRLRIGYIFASCDAAAVLEQHSAMLAAHDSERFEIFAYAIGPGLAPEAAAEISRTVSCLRNLDSTPHEAMADSVKTDSLDIAVDLTGFARGSRPALFAARLAPLHIACPGYPGTIGTAAYDYLVSDATVCPPGSERYHNEFLLRLPEGYMAVAPANAGSDSLDRTGCGLPAEGFVFCCFASGGSISQREFGIWMRLLGKTPGSVLWLQDNGDHATSNLRRSAAACGIDPDRLVFAPPMPPAEQLARLPLADLFLDTFTVNATASARAALAGGLPVLTLPGQQFAARTGASLLQAAGLPELIAASIGEFEEMAARLASDPEACAALRGKLLEQHKAAPLFSPQRFTRQIEAAFDAAYSRHLQGQAPDHLTLS
ncbi:O-linked N-acetylglucosamine transferase, SPINDLY family protein [Leisingera sp. ANG-Vp]|uniref:O-linked N-acetylglucosamine transferase, SPINDLY family protein n=1 Tax=Leisingera sp. ANG-Vp TaxID=1577896 RepID=UPI0005808324|nr:glycosyltransferase family 41 protein [Leisingera sp. ANG-Vp]KIC13557.1 UDP-N-acetylglucosamine--peptide N-acetylglucosaminyltransferase subunit [Leisingera sp. ANG-Vp]